MNSLRAVAAAAGWHLSSAAALLRRDPVTLLYHGVPSQPDTFGYSAKVFAEHIEFLERHFCFVEPHGDGVRGRRFRKPPIILTFDDGFRNNAEVVAPILAKRKIPAVFFISSRHCEPSKYLWFAYLRGLEAHYPSRRLLFRGETFDFSLSARRASVQRLQTILLDLKPHPTAMYDAIEQELPHLEDFIPSPVIQDHYAGLLPEQVAELASNPLFTIGAHTVDHPLMMRCTPEENLRQIVENKEWLGRLTGRNIDTFAYPAGEFNDSTIEQCVAAGIQYGYTVYQRLKVAESLERTRLGVYYPSLFELGLKVRLSKLILRAQQFNYV